MDDQDGSDAGTPRAGLGRVTARQDEAYALRQEGLTNRQIGERLGITRDHARRLCYEAWRRQQPWYVPTMGRRSRGEPAHKFDWEKNPARCKCGLMLPCVCLPGIYEVAAGRNGSASGDF